MKKKSTIKDIAEECGISIGTVDRILHQRGRFSLETEEKVKEAMQRLNYKPKHAIPSSLVSPHFKIGVNYPLDSTTDSFWETASFGISMAENQLRPLKIKIIRECSPSFNFEQQAESIQKLLDQEVDAIVTTAFDSSTEFNFNELIPKEIPFATVVNKSWSDKYLFHIGPNDEAMGSLMAKLISLYCHKPTYIALISPSIELDGTHKRISGFVNKVNNELNDINILQVAPVIARTPNITYQMISIEAQKLLNTYLNLDALYVTSGFSQPVCDVVKASGRKGVQVFGHECFNGIKSYLSDGSLTATIYQNPRQQWYKAIITMVDYLTTHELPPKDINADCCIITKESLPLITI